MSSVRYSRYPICDASYSRDNTPFMARPPPGHDGFVATPWDTLVTLTLLVIPLQKLIVFYTFINNFITWNEMHERDQRDFFIKGKLYWGHLVKIILKLFLNNYR